MAQSQKKDRQRFSPEVRRSMIMDQAAAIVAADGVAALSVEQLSKHADISKSLIYNYFDNLTELLKELLNRELKTLRRQQIEVAEKATTFEELVRGLTHQYLTYISERGLIIERLQAEPSISKKHGPTDYGRIAAVEYLANIVAENFEIPLELARAATDISFGLPASAGEYLLRTDMPLHEIEEMTASMVVGAITKVRDDYPTRRKLLKPRINQI